MALNKVENLRSQYIEASGTEGRSKKKSLFRRIKEGDEEARELYIKGNLRLVLSVIKRFFPTAAKIWTIVFSDWLHWAYKKQLITFDTTLNVKNFPLMQCL